MGNERPLPRGSVSGNGRYGETSADFIEEFWWILPKKGSDRQTRSNWRVEQAGKAGSGGCWECSNRSGSENRTVWVKFRVFRQSLPDRPQCCRHPVFTYIARHAQDSAGESSPAHLRGLDPAALRHILPRTLILEEVVCVMINPCARPDCFWNP